jgi:hypothetical protein
VQCCVQYLCSNRVRRSFPSDRTDRQTRLMFLASTGDHNLSNPELSMDTSQLWYFSTDNDGHQNIGSEENMRVRRKEELYDQLPFLEYATSHWLAHVLRLDFSTIETSLWTNIQTSMSPEFRLLWVEVYLTIWPGFLGVFQLRRALSIERIAYQLQTQASRKMASLIDSILSRLLKLVNSMSDILRDRPEEIRHVDADAKQDS